MSRYLLTQSAKDDLSEIRTYLIEQAGARVARHVLSEITAGFQLLAQTPGAGHVREDLTERPLKFWSVFSYLVVYDPAATPIRIARVLHAARDIPALFERQPPTI